jgi:hypothetical protein
MQAGYITNNNNNTNKTSSRLEIIILLQQLFKSNVIRGANLKGQEFLLTIDGVQKYFYPSMIELRSRLKNLMGLVSHVQIGANDYKCEVNCKAVRLS